MMSTTGTLLETNEDLGTLIERAWRHPGVNGYETAAANAGFTEPQIQAADTVERWVNAPDIWAYDPNAITTYRLLANRAVIATIATFETK
jgi:hypothetical protein